MDHAHRASLLRRLAARGIVALLPVTMGLTLVAPTAAHAYSDAYYGDGYNSCGARYCNDGYYDDGYSRDGYYRDPCRSNISNGFVSAAYVPTSGGVDVNRVVCEYLYTRSVDNRRYDDRRYLDDGRYVDDGGGDTVIFEDSPVTIDF